MRRCNDALYFTDDVTAKLKNGEHLSIEDFAGIFFPAETNQKQYKCALTLMQALQTQGVVENTQLKQLISQDNDRRMLLSHVLPKLQKFNTVKSTGGKNAKRYELTLSDDFYTILENTIRNWIRTTKTGRREFLKQAT